MNRATPESKGISSRHLVKMLKKIDRLRIPMHSLLIARGDDVLLDAYWAPFNENTHHRMNSVTKSFVALAVGKLIEEGRLSLDDRAVDFLPEAEEYDVPEERRRETVRDLLTMRTCYTLRPGKHWVRYKLYDRIRTYLTNPVDKPSGSMFYYDSLGSYILTVIVERIVGKPFLEYLKESFLGEIGFSSDARCITDAMGYSWGDSGLLCTARDLYIVGKFIRQGGVWNGKRYMNEQFLHDAVSCISSSASSGNVMANSSHGYGYQIWHEIEGGFGFHGMGMQYMICIPKLDFYLVCTADTQGYDEARAIFLDMYEELVREGICDTPLAEDPESYRELCEYASSLQLTSVMGERRSEIAEYVKDTRYILDENPMDIRSLTLRISDEGGELIYETPAGERHLPFGMLSNVMGEFDHDGYDNLIIGESPKGYKHPMAASAAWIDRETLLISAHMIGNHLGRLNIRLSFTADRIAVEMKKTTNCFLNEYEGYAIGRKSAVL